MHSALSYQTIGYNQSFTSASQNLCTAIGTDRSLPAAISAAGAQRAMAAQRRARLCTGDPEKRARRVLPMPGLGLWRSTGTRL